jgi:hypothetical protein
VRGQRGDGEAQRIGTVGEMPSGNSFCVAFSIFGHLRLHQAAGALVDQRVDGDAVDDVQRVEHVALGLGHLLACASRIRPVM